MGLFKKKISPEEMQAREENKKLLETFNMTKALGVKKYAVAEQFIYDEDARQFCVVEGPAETFKERNPYVIGFDQVKDVRLIVEEHWSEDKSEYAPNGHGILLQENYSKVYWRYDFFVEIDTEHEFAETIRYKMNFKTTVLQVKPMGIMVRRGLGIAGTYRGEEIAELVDTMTEMIGDDEKAISRRKTVDFITRNRPDTVTGKLIADAKDDIYIKKLENIRDHVKRARRISKLLGKAE